MEATGTSMSWYDQDPECFTGGFSTRNLSQSVEEFFEGIFEEDLHRSCRRDLRERVEWWSGTLEEFLRYHRDFRFYSGDGREGGPGYEIWVREIPLSEWVELSHEFDDDDDGDDVGGWDCESEEGEELEGEDLEEFERHMLRIQQYDQGDLDEYDDYPDIDCDWLVDEGDVEPNGDYDGGRGEDDVSLPIEGGISFWG